MYIYREMLKKLTKRDLLKVSVKLVLKLRRNVQRERSRRRTKDLTVMSLEVEMEFSSIHSLIFKI